MSQFGEIWSIVRNEFVEKRNFSNSREQYLKNPEKFIESLKMIVSKRINDFQKLNPVSIEIVEKGFQIIDFNAKIRTEFVQSTLRRYLEYINTHFDTDSQEQNNDL